MGSEFRPATVAAVASALIAIAFAGGGFGPEALGAATAAVWLLVALPLLWARPERVGGPLALALAALALLAALTALSLQWAADDGAAFEDLVRVLAYLGALTGVGIWCRPGDGPSWLAGIALAAVVVAVASVGSRLLGIGSPDADLAASLPAVGGRLSFPLGYWNALGYLAAAALPILIWIAAGRAAGDGGEEAPRPWKGAWVSALAVASFVPVSLVIHLTSSRGALLAAVAGAAVSIWFSADRRRALLAAAVGGGAAAVAVVAAAGRGDVLDATAGDLTVSGVAVTAVALVAATAAALLFVHLRARTVPLPGRLRRLARPAIALAAVALAAAAVVAVGPSALIGDFKPAAGEAGDAGGALASGSGRSEFWETALDAFGEDPLRGVGAGGYAAFWAREGDLDVSVANAHSAPLESLAELGVPGGLALLALAVAVAIAARRLVADPLARAGAGAAAGVAVVGLIAFTLDWTWEMPAAGAPAILAAGLLAGRGLRPPSAAGPAGAALRAGGGGLAIAVPVVLIAAVSVWAGAVIALSAVQLERSSSALADGDLPEAAVAARAAETIEPWSADASLQLAEIEQVGGNLDAARRRAERAIELSPDDFRAWLLLADISASLGEPEAAGNYALHAVSLAPGALSRRGATLQGDP